MRMTPLEIKTTVYWASNMNPPIDRDTQIMLMKTARERRKEIIELLNNQKESNYDVD